MRRFTGGQQVPRPSQTQMKSRRNRPVRPNITREANVSEPMIGRKIDTYQDINPEVNRILYDDLIYFFKPENIGGKGWTPDSNNPELVQTLSLYNIINGNPRGSIPRFPEDSGVPVFNSAAVTPMIPDASGTSSDAPVYNSTGSVADLPTRRPGIGGKRRSKKTRRFRR